MIIAKLVTVLVVMVFLLRFKVKIGNAVLASSLILWALDGLDFSMLGQAAVTTLQDPRCWIIVGALYFIMWLEYLLRTRGIMDGFLGAIQLKIKNRKAVMMIISSFLGLLPSLGGAIFSAPMVKKLGTPMGMSKTDQALINYWSRHYSEYANPMAPALLLASATAMVPLNEMLVLLLIYGVISIVMGWLLLGRDVTEVEVEPIQLTMAPRKILLLALSPVALIFILILGFQLNAALATFVSTALLTVVLWEGVRDFKTQVVESFNIQIFWTVANILFFQRILIDTGMVSGLIEFFSETGMSPIIGIAILSFLMGLLTGMAQGFVAIVFPFVAGVAAGDATFAVLIYVIGVTGQMMTPTHLCLSISVSYFNVEWGTFYRKLIAMQGTVGIFAILIYWLQS